MVSSISSGMVEPSDFGRVFDAAPGVKAQAEEVRGLELAVHDAAAGVAGKVVLVVEGGGAAVLDQFGHRHDRGVVEGFLGQAREDRIDPVQPLDHRQLGPVEIGAVAHEGLEEMVMGVDEAGIDEPAGGVDHLGPRRGGQRGADGADGGAFGQKVLVHQNGQMGRADDQAAQFLSR